jgi:hypothetical protein
MDMQKLLSELQTKHPGLRFTPGEQFCWSPETNEIFYKKGARGQNARWSLLHETGHALLGHKNYDVFNNQISCTTAALTATPPGAFPITASAAPTAPPKTSPKPALFLRSFMPDFLQNHRRRIGF